MADAEQSNLTTLTVDLLSAYVANNNVEHSAIPELIKSTHAALRVIDSPEPPAPEEPEHKPAVTVRKSLSSPAHIISMIDGKPYQTLKRHLAKHGLTAEQYRERYGLPKTYPMVATAYSEARREIAKKLGLGNRAKGAEEQATPPAPTSAASAAETAPAPAKAKAGAPKVAKQALAKGAKTTPKAAAKPKSASPAKAQVAPKAAPVEPSPAATPPKAAPKTRKASAAQPDTVQAPEAATKPAPRKRGPKAAQAAS